MQKLYFLFIYFFSAIVVFAQNNGNKIDTQDCNQIKAIIYPRATQFYNPSSGYDSYYYPVSCQLVDHGLVQDKEIEISDLKKGIYLLSIETISITYTSQLIKL
jgi:hypothetical protein